MVQPGKLSASGKTDRQKEASAAARARANIFDFLAALLNQKPDRELIRTLKSNDLDVLVSQAEGSEPDSPIVLGLKQMARFLESASTGPEPGSEGDLGLEWARLFRGITPRYGPPPPYESVYADRGETVLETIQALNEFYWTSGARLETTATKNRPDYLGMELSFLGFLAEAEAKAWEAGDEQLAQTLQEKARTFFEQHPGSWANKFLTEALNYARTDFYKGFLHLCLGTISQADQAKPGSRR